METVKMQELLYDIQGSTLEQAHDLIMEYAADPNGYESEEDERTETEIIVENVTVGLFQRGDKTVEVRVKLDVPQKLMKVKLWTIDNVLA